MCLFATSPLRRAIHISDVQALRELLSNAGEGSADLINEDFTSDCLFNPFMRNIRPVLQTAVIKNNPEVVQILLQYGADPDMRGPFGETAVHIAARYGGKEVIKTLMKFNADLYVKDSIGNCTIHTAVHPVFGADAGKPERLDIVRLLLEDVGKIEDHRLVNSAGQTPLHLASMMGNATVVQYLLDIGADANAGDINGHKPKDVARDSVISLFS